MQSKKNIIIAILLLFIGASFFYYSKISNSKKIVYVDTDVLLSEFVETPNAKKEFEKSQQEWDAPLKLYQDSIKALVKDMRANENVSAIKKGKLDSLENDFEALQIKVKRASQKKEQELMRPIVAKVNAYINKWGKEKGYSLILTSQQDGVVYVDSSSNVTKNLLDDLNKEYSRMSDAK